MSDVTVTGYPEEIPTGSPSAWAVPLRLLRGCEARSEPLLRRERCHHHTVRVCDAALLVRFDPVWCTLAVQRAPGGVDRTGKREVERPG